MSERSSHDTRSEFEDIASHYEVTRFDRTVDTPADISEYDDGADVLILPDYQDPFANLDTSRRNKEDVDPDAPQEKLKGVNEALLRAGAYDLPEKRVLGSLPRSATYSSDIAAEAQSHTAAQLAAQERASARAEAGMQLARIVDAVIALELAGSNKEKLTDDQVAIVEGLTEAQKQKIIERYHPPRIDK